MSESPSPNNSTELPLSAWRVRNFKSIQQADLGLAPLTILVGANSSGKSSLLQSVLIVVQAAQGGNQGSTFPLNGPLVSVGAFDEVRFAHSQAAVGVGGKLRLASDIAYAAAGRFRTKSAQLTDQTSTSDRSILDWQITFDGPAVNEPGSADVASVTLHAGEFGHESAPSQDIDLVAKRRGQGPTEADAERFRAGSLILPTRVEFALGFVGELTTSVSDTVPIRGLQLKAGLPHKVVTTWRDGDAMASVWVEHRIFRPFWESSSGVGGGTRDRSIIWIHGERELLDKWADIAADEIREWSRRDLEEPITLPGFLARRPQPGLAIESHTLRGHADYLVEAIRNRLDLANEVFLPPERPVVGLLDDVVSEAHTFFRDRVVYLGPLRQDPQVVYKTAPVSASGFIGTKGEYLATVLHASRGREVMSFGNDGEIEPMRLIDAVNRWVTRLEIADAIQTRDLGRLGIQVSVQRGAIQTPDLTSVGVGVSQLLPVIVMCLLTEPGSLILLEQPELHLHPGLQQKLGDFLLACARSGRQLIVETHSEYIVSRLRRWIAEDESGTLLNAVALYFVEQNAEDASQFRLVAVNELGGVENWPIGFFDQASNESRRILEAGIRKRSRVGRSAGDRAPN